MEWISVKDNPPKDTVSVLVYFPTEDRGEYFVARYYGNFWDVEADTYPNRSHYSDFAPLYWIPLPKPPSEPLSRRHENGQEGYQDDNQNDNQIGR